MLLTFQFLSIYQLLKLCKLSQKYCGRLPCSLWHQVKFDNRLSRGIPKLYKRLLYIAIRQKRHPRPHRGSIIRHIHLPRMLSLTHPHHTNMILSIPCCFSLHIHCRETGTFIAVTTIQRLGDVSTGTPECEDRTQHCVFISAHNTGVASVLALHVVFC